MFCRIGTNQPLFCGGLFLQLEDLFLSLGAKYMLCHFLISKVLKRSQHLYLRILVSPVL